MTASRRMIRRELSDHSDLRPRRELLVRHTQIEERRRASETMMGDSPLKNRPDISWATVPDSQPDRTGAHA